MALHCVTTSSGSCFLWMGLSLFLEESSNLLLQGYIPGYLEENCMSPSHLLFLLSAIWLWSHCCIHANSDKSTKWKQVWFLSQHTAKSCPVGLPLSLQSISAHCPSPTECYWPPPLPHLSSRCEWGPVPACGIQSSTFWPRGSTSHFCWLQGLVTRSYMHQTGTGTCNLTNCSGGRR